MRLHEPSRHPGTHGALARGRRQGQVLGHRPSPGRPVGIEVVDDDQPRAGTAQAAEHAFDERREALRPIRVGRLAGEVGDRNARSGGPDLGRIGRIGANARYTRDAEVTTAARGDGDGPTRGGELTCDLWTDLAGAEDEVLDGHAVDPFPGLLDGGAS